MAMVDGIIVEARGFGKKTTIEFAVEFCSALSKRGAQKSQDAV